MANTILEKLQERYPSADGINDARNIAEAVGAINGTGGRGANAIADQVKALTNDETDEPSDPEEPWGSEFESSDLHS